MSNLVYKAIDAYKSDGIHIGQLLDVLDEDVDLYVYYIEDPNEEQLEIFLDSEIARIEVNDGQLRVGLFKPQFGLTYSIFL